MIFRSETYEYPHAEVSHRRGLQTLHRRRTELARLQAACEKSPGAVRVSKIGKNYKISKILQIFGGLVLGCIKAKFCKKICVWQHFPSSTRCAHFRTAA